MIPPLVSVIIAVYNGGRTIGKCLDCLRNQDYNNIEIIVVDDRSTDETVSIIEQYLTKIPNLHLIRNKEHLFQGESLNKGIKKANGEFIQLLDSDYYLDPNSLSKAVKFLNMQPRNVAAIMGSVYNLPMNYWTMLKHISMLGGYQKKTVREIDTFSNNNVMIMRSVLEKCEMIYNPALTRSFDIEFATRLHGKGYVFYYFPLLKATHDHPLKSGYEYFNFLRKEADGYVKNRTLNPNVHYNFIKNKLLFMFLLPILPIASTVKKITNGTERKVLLFYPVLIPMLLTGQVYFWLLILRNIIGIPDNAISVEGVE